MSAIRPDPSHNEKLDQPKFIQQQYEFTRHCRDPKSNPAPANIEERRMAIYRDLLYNNVEGFIANNFPVARAITSDDRWHLMIRDYFANHKASTPLFPKLPTEFLQYLEQERINAPDHVNDPPYLLELAHYEWVELELTIDMREIDFTGVNIEGDLLAEVPVLNPLIQATAFEYPVHRIGPDFLPEEKPQQPSYLVVYRDRDDNVGFMELNSVTARLLASMQNDGALTGCEHLTNIANELQHPQPEVVINGGLQVMQQMFDRDILLGTLKV